MGRAKKQGMDYFPVDVNLMESTAIKVLTARFGAEGFYLYMFLMCRIHLGGYYIEVSEDFISCAAVDTRIKEKTAADMIELMCTKGLFDEELYEKYGILTSLEIQETYREVKCSHGRAVTVKREYWLDHTLSANLAFEEDLRENGGENSTEKGVFSTEKSDIPPQNALKESKEKERKEEESKLSLVPVGTCPPDYNAIIEQYNSICTALPKVRDLTEPRKKAIKSALKRLGQEGLTELFRKTAASDFLSGRKNDWHATFDWILKPANLTKIIEGNYDNTSPATETTDYTCGGKYVNMLALSGDLAPEDYPF